MESYSMACRIQENRLTVTWYVDDCDAWGGNDLIKRLSFDELNTVRLFRLFGYSQLPDEPKSAAFLEKRFGKNMYESGFEGYCKGNGIHDNWVEYVDQPGLYFKEGHT